MIDRRLFLQALAACGLAAGAIPARAAARPLVVMTSYPAEVIGQNLDAFSKARPDISVDIVWHSGGDAHDYLLGDGRGKVDVYWSPSVRNFLDFKRRGVLSHLDIDRSGLPGRIGKQDISDPDGFFEAAEIAGYGLAFNPGYLGWAGLAAPTDWTDLARPEYAGHITVPVPSRVGFAGVITEIVLQAHGWRDGWALLAQIAANASLHDGHGEETIAAVLKGDKGIALTIDFMASQAIAKGAPLRFVYPKATAFEPANIAIPVQAPDPDAALEFVRFILSDQGQRLLVHSDLRRLAIRPSVYRDLPAGYVNPWVLPGIAEHAFDDPLLVRREELNKALYDRLIYAPRDRLAPVWAAFRRLESQPGLPADARAPLDEARAHLTAVPVGEDEALALAPGFAGRRRDGKGASPQSEAAEAAWSHSVAANIDSAASAVARAEAAAKRT